jgi:hypothetical protein
LSGNIYGTIGTATQGTIDHDSLANFESKEHFTQGNITTVGTVTSGNVSAILPSNPVSSSAQIATNISGAFTAASSSLASRTTTLEGNGVFTATGISGSWQSQDFANLSAAGISSSFQLSGSYLLDTTDTLTGDLTVTGDISGSNLYITASGENVIQVGNSGNYMTKWEWHRNGERKWVIYNDGRTSNDHVQDALIFKSDGWGGDLVMALGPNDSAKFFGDITASGDIIVGGTISSSGQEYSGTVTAPSFFNSTDNHYIVTSSISGALWITSSLGVYRDVGNVRIGTAVDSGKKLTVKGDISASDDIYVGDNVYLESGGDIRWNFLGSGTAIRIVEVSGDVRIEAVQNIDLMPDNDLIIRCGTGTTPFARFFSEAKLRLSSNNNATAPTSTLEVQGDISASGDVGAVALLFDDNLSLASLKNLANGVVPVPHRIIKSLSGIRSIF